MTSDTKDIISIIIPAFNEEESVGSVISRIKDVLLKDDIQHEIILVDDGSSDGTSIIAEKAGARVIRHNENIGYGAALKTGIRAAKNEKLVITDADGTYPAEAIPELLKKLDTADMVIGARRSQNKNIPILRKPAKWILNRLARYITGQHIPDLNSGMRSFRRSFILDYFSLLPDKFSFTTTITVAALCDRYTISYHDVEYEKRTGKSKVVAWDFVSFVTLVLRLSMLFNPLKVFVPVALFSFLLGIAKLVFDIAVAIQNAGGITFSLFIHRVVSTSSLMLLLSGLQILLIGMMADGITRRVLHSSPNNIASNGVKSSERKPESDLDEGI